MIKKMNLFRKSICLVTVAGFSSLFQGCGSEPEPPAEVVRPVRTVLIEEELGITTRRYTAQVNASERVSLSFQVSGQIVKFNVVEGDEVKKGQVLAEIDEIRYKSDYLRAVAIEREAKSDFERINNLYKKGVSSKAELDVKKKGYEVAQADVKIAEKALKDTKLKAPFAGVIGKVFADNFEDVQAKQLVLTLNNISTLEISIDVPEDEMSKLRRYKESEVKVGFAAIKNKMYDLQVKEYATEADPETLTYQVQFLLDTPEEATILPGMSAMVYHKAKLQSKNRFLVPATAVMSDSSGEGSNIWLFNKADSTVKKVPVTIDSLQGKSVEVSSGVKVGDVVVTAGVHYLVDGQVVKNLAE